MMTRTWPGLLLCSMLGCGSSAAPAASVPAPSASLPAPALAGTPTAPASTAPAPPASSAPSGFTPMKPALPVRGSLRLEKTLVVGKWPEDVKVLGGAAWVTESGDRSVARVPFDSDARPTRVKVGRLPVQLHVAPDGKLYTVAQTDGTLWEIDPTTARGRTVARVSGCVQSFTLGEGAAWMLLWSGCSSQGSSVVRVDLATRKQVTSPETGPWAWSIAQAQGRAWVAIGDGTLAFVGGEVLNSIGKVGKPVPGIPARSIVAGPQGIYSSALDVVSRTDPKTATTTHQTTLSEPIAALFADAEGVVAVGRKGTVSLLSPLTLELTAELTSPVNDALPHAIARSGGKLLIVDHGTSGPGRLHVLSVAPADSPR